MYKQIAINTVRNELGQAQDNYNRAKMAYKNYSPLKMKEKYGHSDDTPTQILEEYEKREQLLSATLKWLESMKDV